jgi:hypothetical protein
MDENPPEKKILKKASEAKTHTSKTKALVIDQVFVLYSDLITGDARWPWNKLLRNKLIVNLGRIYTGLITPRSAQHCGIPS